MELTREWGSRLCYPTPLGILLQDKASLCKGRYSPADTKDSPVREVKVKVVRGFDHIANAMLGFSVRKDTEGKYHSAE